MKKTTIYCLLTCLIAFAACSKSDDNNPTPNSSTSYELYGLNQTVVTASSNTPGSPVFISSNVTFPFWVKQISGQKESVTLSAYDIPSGCYLTFLDLNEKLTTTAQIGDTVLCSLDMDSTIKAGTYYTKIKSVSTSGITVIDSFLIDVK